MSITEYLRGEILTESPFGKILRISDSQTFILKSRNHKFDHSHIRPETPEITAAKIKLEMATGQITGAVISGSMHSGKTETLGELAYQYGSVTYIRPVNGRPIAEEHGLQRITRIVQPTTKRDFLASLQQSSTELVILDELNLAGFLAEDDINSLEFFTRLFHIVDVTMMHGQKVALGLLDRQFNGVPFTPIQEIETWAGNRIDVAKIHMQATCICGQTGNISNRVQLIEDDTLDFKVYSPVPLDSGVFGPNDEYLVLCNDCFTMVNGLYIKQS